jgi:hypothetical protein
MTNRDYDTASQGGGSFFTISLSLPSPPRDSVGEGEGNIRIPDGNYLKTTAFLGPYLNPMPALGPLMDTGTYFPFERHFIDIIFMNCTFFA